MHRENRANMGATVGWTPLRERPVVIAGIATAIGYALVIGTFLDLYPFYPAIDLRTSTMLSHSIAVINASAVLCLLVGWYWIRRNAVFKHRIAMSTAFGLIVLFLVLYLLRIGGGGTKEFVGPSLVTAGYLIMLAIHIVLSVLAVPLVLYVLILGISHTPPELRRTPHARIGRLAAGVWIVSLVLGLVTYVMLEHLYGWEYVSMIVPHLG